MKNKKILIFLIIFFIFLFLDQVFKYYIVENNINLVVIKDILLITYDKNYGVAFSLMENNNLITIITSFFLIIYIIRIIYIEFIQKNKYTEFLNITFAIFFAGIFGNLLDRIIRGYVVDFINLPFFAVFNLADIFITYGVLVLLYRFIKE